MRYSECVWKLCNGLCNQRKTKQSNTTIAVDDDDVVVLDGEVGKFGIRTVFVRANLSLDFVFSSWQSSYI